MQYDEPNYSKLITDSPSVIEKRLEETLTKSLVTPNTVISLPDDMRMGHRLGLMYYNELEKGNIQSTVALHVQALTKKMQNKRRKNARKNS